MFEYLEQLRKKPVAYRRRVVALSTTAITGLIVVVWVATLRFGSAPASDAKMLENELKPFQEIKASIGSFYSSVVEAGTNLFTPSSTTSAPTTL